MFFPRVKFFQACTFLAYRIDDDSRWILPSRRGNKEKGLRLHRRLNCCCWNDRGTSSVILGFPTIGLPIAPCGVTRPFHSCTIISLSSLVRLPLRPIPRWDFPVSAATRYRRLSRLPPIIVVWNIILPNPPYTRHVHVPLCRFDFLLFSFNRTRNYGLVFRPTSFARSNCTFHLPTVTVTCLREAFDTREVRKIYSYSRLVKETYLSSAMSMLA